ncbi:hypothetical protein GLOIN_2v1662849 [Rhizophagus clarus]|uniref:Uncharacterized protein n=1 Tax=Rhizophagus clarus TaxID=94130 RepID=A0A8H3QJV7_9GLOM|nr:hypothetical protein GLOIN_2v1662849 [Rhizophagus clarus]
MENFQGITVSPVEEQVERLVKTFGEAEHPLRFKALSQNTGILNMLLSLIQQTPIIPVDDSTTPNMDIDQPESSKKSLANADKQDSSNKLHHNKTQSSSSNTKTKNSNKILLKAVEKIYVNNEIPDDKKHHVKDIFIYDISINWTQEKIIAKLKACDVVSITIKKQQKYQTLRLKICLSSFTLAFFDSNIWQYSLGGQAI